MSRKKQSGPPAPRNPVAHNAGKFNKAATHTDRKKEQKKTGPTPEQPQGDERIQKPSQL